VILKNSGWHGQIAPVYIRQSRRSVRGQAAARPQPGVGSWSRRRPKGTSPPPAGQWAPRPTAACAARRERPDLVVPRRPRTPRAAAASVAKARVPARASCRRKDDAAPGTLSPSWVANGMWRRLTRPLAGRGRPKRSTSDVAVHGRAKPDCELCWILPVEADDTRTCVGAIGSQVVPVTAPAQSRTSRTEERSGISGFCRDGRGRGAAPGSPCRSRSDRRWKRRHRSQAALFRAPESWGVAISLGP
jgi:hypothetical protein